MTTNDQNIRELAEQFQNVADTGGFNPFALFAGSTSFHSIFVADFSPSIQRARTAFQAGVPGPLDSLVEEFIQQGHNPATAREQVQLLLNAAVGMCVITLQNDQSCITIPQLFFGHFSQEYKEQVIQLCGNDFPDPEELSSALNQLAMTLQPGQHSPNHFASAQGITKPIDYWKDFSQQLRDLHEHGIGFGVDDRQKDLAHWVGSSIDLLADTGHELDGDELLDVIYCHCAARNVSAALRQLSNLLTNFEPEDEELLLTFDAICKVAIQDGLSHLVQPFIAEHTADILPPLGGIYEWEIIRFKLLVSDQASLEAQLAQAEELKRADRKSFRHDLNREPLWQVTTQDTGPLLELAQAAELLDRSLNFVGKRLESGAIPFVIQEGERKIPEHGLKAWKAIMETYELID